MASSSPGGPTNLGMPPNVGGLLCYAPCCLGLIFSAVVAIVEKQSKFLRFHAFQSLLLHGAAIALWVAFVIARAVATMIAGPLAVLVWGVQLLVSVALLGLVIFMMVKAYNNEQFELPMVGELAKQWA